MLFRRCLAMIALAIASLATSACADLTRPNEITIKAEPAPVQAAPVPPPVPAMNRAAADAAARPAASGGGG